MLAESMSGATAVRLLHWFAKRIASAPMTLLRTPADKSLDDVQRGIYPQIVVGIASAIVDHALEIDRSDTCSIHRREFLDERAPAGREVYTLERCGYRAVAGERDAAVRA